MGWVGGVRPTPQPPTPSGAESLRGALPQDRGIERGAGGTGPRSTRYKAPPPPSPGPHAQRRTGKARPERQLNKVDLPAPEGPMRNVTFPGSTKPLQYFNRIVWGRWRAHGRRRPLTRKIRSLLSISTGGLGMSKALGASDGGAVRNRLVFRALSLTHLRRTCAQAQSRADDRARLHRQKRRLLVPSGPRGRRKKKKAPEPPCHRQPPDGNRQQPPTALK